MLELNKQFDFCKKGEKRMSREGLELILVKKQDLLKALKLNRDEHRSTFLEALDGYSKEAIKALNERVEDAKRNKRISLTFRLVQPEDHTRDYDRVIRMLEMSVSEELEITQDQFANFVMDDWAWSRQFYASNSTYSSKAATKLSNLS